MLDCIGNLEESPILHFSISPNFPSLILYAFLLTSPGFELGARNASLTFAPIIPPTQMAESRDQSQESLVSSLWTRSLIVRHGRLLFQNCQHELTQALCRLFLVRRCCGSHRRLLPLPA